MDPTESQPEPLPGEDLVAYLDGELPPDDCSQIEQRLASDDQCRQQVAELERAWDALDELPQATVSDKFSRTTIAMVTVAAERELADMNAHAPTVHRKRTLLLAVVGVALATIGYAATRVVLPDANVALLADLPVIEQIDLLMQVEDIEFLRKLSTLPLEQFVSDPTSLHAEVEHLQQAGAATADERRDWIDELSPEEQASLAAKSKRFRSLSPSPSEQQRLRMLEQEISQAEDANGLRAAMLAYGQWLTGRTPGERAELRSLETDDRIRRIGQYLRQEGRWAAQRLSAEDSRVLAERVQQIADARLPEIREQMRIEGVVNPQALVHRRRAAVALWIINRDLANEASREAMFEQLTEPLSPAARDDLNSFRRPWRERLLQRWVRDALQPRFGLEELENFFEQELKNNQREQLLALSPEEMQAELEQLYITSQLGLVEWERRTGRGNPNGFGRGRGRPPWQPDQPPGRPGQGPPPGGQFFQNGSGPPPNGPLRERRHQGPGPGRQFAPPQRGGPPPDGRPPTDLPPGL